MFKVYDIPKFTTLYSFCKYFREQILQVTLKEMSAETGVKFGTISAFENGRSHNLNHLYNYMDMCVTKEHKDIFKQGVADTLEEGRDNV